ncbi:MAG: DUF4974 domain-containing protein [Chitinophagaceae bacterium]|nr:MAG: DUF4974 domain-containing protein [Chitinophagaceae bacterium]
MEEKQSYHLFYIAGLLEKYLNEELTLAELDDLENWINVNEHNRKVFEKITNKDQREAALSSMANLPTETMLEKLKMQINMAETQTHTRTIRRYRYWAAAGITILLAVGAFLFFNNKPKQVSDKPIAQSMQIAPAIPQARLVTSNGQTLLLNDTGDSSFMQGTTNVRQQKGQLSYLNSGEAGKLQYNTLITPRGGIYMVTLDDGTKVWLNAASSLHYPVHFASGERKVELDGEAYFEVSEDNRRPFKVAVGDMNIEVLGTHFNVMAYDDEQQTTTTLLEGKVKVSAGTIGKIIKPGQEVQLNKSTDMLTVKKADTVASISWKNGLFEFDNTDMKSILRELSRWYNVDIVYSVGVKDRYFTGTAPRSMSLNDMLKGLSSSGIDFRVEGRKIIVLK